MCIYACAYFWIALRLLTCDSLAIRIWFASPLLSIILFAFRITFHPQIAIESHLNSIVRIRFAFFIHSILFSNSNHDQKLIFWNLFFSHIFQIWCTNVHPEDYRVAILSDSHSPHKYRVIGALANSKEFAELFQCKQGTAMNPARKCEVW